MGVAFLAVTLLYCRSQLLKPMHVWLAEAFGVKQPPTSPGSENGTRCWTSQSHPSTGGFQAGDRERSEADSVELMELGEICRCTAEYVLQCR